VASGVDAPLSICLNVTGEFGGVASGVDATLSICSHVHIVVPMPVRRRDAARRCRSRIRSLGRCAVPRCDLRRTSDSVATGEEHSADEQTQKNITSFIGTEVRCPSGKFTSEELETGPLLGAVRMYIYTASAWPLASTLRYQRGRRIL
jgi:hypothetical protein